MYEAIMIDIETMSSHPTKALVLSIAAQRFAFCRDGGDPRFLEPHEWDLNVREQLIMGRVVDAETQAWWRGSDVPDAARERAMIVSERPVAEVLSELAAFYDVTTLGVGHPVDVWARGNMFDFGNIESLYESFDLKVPWGFRSVMDARTYCRHSTIVPGRVLDEALSMFTPHDPLEDCKKQVYELWRCWRGEQ